MATTEDLRKLQLQPLEEKVQRTLGLISEWYAHWENQCYVSFSGGKDSTVLADIAAKWCAIARIPLDLVFVDTGLEYPEIKDHVRTFSQYLREKYDITVNLTVLRPKKTFAEVITKYGYPMIGKNQANCIRLARKNLIQKKYSLRLMRLGFSMEDAVSMGWKIPEPNIIERFHRATDGSKFNIVKYRELLDVDFLISDICCDTMKKQPLHEYERITGRHGITAQMAEESMLRENAWMKNGCNAFDAKEPKSNPMSFWREQDVLAYIRQNNIPIASVYGDIVYEDDPEQVRMDETFCGERLCTTGCNRTGCVFCGFGAHLEKGEGRFERLKRTHPKLWKYCIYGGGYGPADGMWKPTKDGLGMGHVFDVLNGLYGDGFIPYGKEDK